MYSGDPMQRLRRGDRGFADATGLLRDAEVEDLDAGRPVGTSREKKVRGLQVAVDDTDRVRLGERLARLQDAVDRLRDRQAAPP